MNRSNEPSSAASNLPILLNMKKKEPLIVPIYDNYLNHFAAPKRIPSPFEITKTKTNHPNSYGAEVEIVADYPFGNTTVECEVRQGLLYNYSFSYKSDIINSRVLARLDTGDGTHHNRVPDIPLELSSVPTPHIHKYRGDGYSVAYPIPGVDYSTEASTIFDYKDGFDYFCSNLNITDNNNESPQFIFAPDGIIVFPPQDSDPNEGADFENTF